MPNTHSFGNRLRHAVPEPVRPAVDDILKKFNVETEPEPEEKELDIDPTVSRLTKTGVAMNRLMNPLEASTDRLNVRQSTSAELVQLSHVFHKKGMEATKERAERTLPGYEIDFDLTDDHMLVARNPRGKLEVAFRGTDPSVSNVIKDGKVTGVYEPLMWVPVLHGVQDKLFKQHKMDEYGKRIREKYKVPVKDIVEHVQGYSMGGDKAYRFGDMFGVNTTLFNPLVGKKFSETQVSPNVKHNIVRTTSDIATFIGVVASKKQHSNVTVDSIHPAERLARKEFVSFKEAVADVGKAVLAETHALEHFTLDTRGQDRVNEAYEAQQRIEERSRRHNEEVSTATEERLPLLNAEFHSSNRADAEIILRHTEANSVPAKGLYGATLRNIRNAAGRGKSAAAALGANIAGNIGIDKIYEKIEDYVPLLDNEIVQTATVAGVTEAGVQKLFIQRLASGMVNYKTAIVSSMGQAVGAQQLEPQLYNDFLNAGMNIGDASVWSQTTAGITATAVVTGAIESVGVLAGAGTAIATMGEVGLANAWNPVGEALLAATAVTATATAIGGALSWLFSTREERKMDMMLSPFRNPVVDADIARNPNIVMILKMFNETGDFRPEKVKQIEQTIQAIIDSDANIQNNHYGYKVHLKGAPKGTIENTKLYGQDSVMLEGDYSKMTTRMMTAPIEEFNRAEGHALLQTYNPEYLYLTDEEMDELVNEMATAHGDLPQDLLDVEDSSLRLSLILAHNPEYKQSIQRHAEEYVEHEKVVFDEATSTLRDNLESFISTQPDLVEYIEEGRVDDFNRRIHELLSDRGARDKVIQGVPARYEDLIESSIPQINENFEYEFTTLERGPIANRYAQQQIEEVAGEVPEPPPPPVPEPSPAPEITVEGD